MPYFNQLYKSVSIHAPTKGATVENVRGVAEVLRFNPRSYERSDTGIGVLPVALLWFQSTLLRKERPFSSW